MDKELITQAVVEALAGEAGNYVRDQIKEQVSDAISKINPAPTPEEQVINEAAKKNEFKRFGDFLTTVLISKRSGDYDGRLTWLDSKKQPATKALSAGTDSAGGYC